MNKNNINSNSIHYYLNKIKKYNNLDKNEIKEIFIKKKNGCSSEKDKEKIITTHLRLVANIAKGYRNSSQYLNYIDLISAGNLGLFRAFDKYDVERGVIFSTYATWWIRQSITREISRYKHLVRKPFRLVENSSKFIREKNEIEKKEGRKLSAKELSVIMNIPKDEILFMLDLQKNDVELPPEITIEPNNDSEISHRWLIKRINEILKKESSRDKKIIRMKLGFTTKNEPSDMRETSYIAKKVGMSIEGIRQVTLRLTDKIRKEIVV